MKKIVALFVIFVMLFSLVACNSKNTICSECKEKLVGDWFFCDEYENGNFEKISITDDAKLLKDGNEYPLRFDCGIKHSSGPRVYGDDDNWVYKITINHDTVNYLFDDSIVLQDNKAITKEYRPMSKYTVVEITEENWRDYFSENFSEHFTKSYELRLETNNWGETEEGYVEKIYTLKDKEKYSYATELTLEVSFTEQLESYEFDLNKKIITNCVVGNVEEGVRTRDEFIYYPYMQTQVDSTYLYSDEIKSGKTLEKNIVKEPQKILRMKGWLVIKNDA